MNNSITDQPEGATPIEDVSGLVQEITTRGELNDAEALNIVNADEWLETARVDDLFTVRFYCELHTRMYDPCRTWETRIRRESGDRVALSPQAAARSG